MLINITRRLSKIVEVSSDHAMLLTCDDDMTFHVGTDELFDRVGCGGGARRSS